MIRMRSRFTADNSSISLSNSMSLVGKYASYLLYKFAKVRTLSTMNQYYSLALLEMKKENEIAIEVISITPNSCDLSGGFIKVWYLSTTRPSSTTEIPIEHALRRSLFAVS
jgi:hypothetical protein